MAKVNAEVLGAVIDGKGRGEKIQIDERSAKSLEAKGYVKVLSKVTSEKGKSAPKKPVTKESVPKPKKKKKEQSPPTKDK